MIRILLPRKHNFVGINNSFMTFCHGRIEQHPWLKCRVVGIGFRPGLVADTGPIGCIQVTFDIDGG